MSTKSGRPSCRLPEPSLNEFRQRVILPSDAAPVEIGVSLAEVPGERPRVLVKPGRQGLMQILLSFHRT